MIVSSQQKVSGVIPVFGCYRWFLACMVAFSHTGSYHHYCGGSSVYAFFVLSGFLITMILQERYGASARSLLAYGANRALRIYPLYWLAIAVAYLVATEIPFLVLKGEILLPRNALEWLFNIELLVKGEKTPLLLSVAWSLKTELWFYVLLPLLVLNRKVMWVWIAVSLLALPYFAWGGIPYRDRYFSVWGASPAFALGALIYVCREKLPHIPHWLAGLVFITLMVLVVNWWAWLPKPFGFGFYFIMLMHAFLAAYLSRQPVSRASRFYRFDRFMGNLSYPIFLFHIPVAEVVRLYLDDSIRHYSWPFFLAAMVPVHLTALVVHYGVESPISRLRGRLRPKA